MSLTSAIKRASIATGLYRRARAVSRRCRPEEQRALEADIAFYRALLPAGALCFDVGANIGRKSEAMLAAGARVVAFEPNALVIPELRARCGHDRHWTLVAAALGREAGVATLHAQASHGMTSFHRDWADHVVGSFEVPIITLDAAIDLHGLPDFCKIDVEGWELEVLLGLSRAIPLLAFEYHATEANIAATRRSLRRLSTFGTLALNLTAAESSTFELSQWQSLDDFLEWFPGDFGSTPLEQRYGDIYVRTEMLSDR